MDQNKIRDVTSSTGCDEKLAHIILEFTDGDIDKACKIIFAIPKDIAVIAGRFTAGRAQKHGVVVCAFNIKTRQLERSMVLVTKEKSIVDEFTDNDPNALFKQIEEAKAKGVSIEVADIADLSVFVARDDNLSLLKDIFPQDGKASEEDLVKWLNDILFKTFADSGLSIKVNVRMIDSFQLNRGEKEIKEEEEKEKLKEQPESEDAEAQAVAEELKPENRRNDSVIILTAQPLISPVRGRQIPKFKVGDQVFADISDPREIGAYLKKLLQEAAAKDHPEYENKIPALIEEMEYSTNTDNVSLIVKFGPGIFGRLLVPRDLKIDAPGRSTEDQDPQAVNSGSWMLWLAVMAFVVLIILMAILKK